MSKTPKVKISQFGKTYKIYIDGVRTPIDTLLELINTPPRALKMALGSDTREKIVRDYVIKAREGVHWKCRVFWKGDYYQLLPNVIEAVGLSSAGASIRMRLWKKGGSMKDLYAPKTKDKKPKVTKKASKQGSWGGLSNEPRSSRLKDII